MKIDLQLFISTGHRKMTEDKVSQHVQQSDLAMYSQQWWVEQQQDRKNYASLCKIKRLHMLKNWFFLGGLKHEVGKARGQEAEARALNSSSFMKYVTLC